MTDDDAAAVEALRLSTWATSFRGLVADAYLDKLHVTEARVQRIRQGLQRPRAARLVAAAGAEVIGFVISGAARGGGLAADTGEVHGLYVAPRWQRQGVGSELLRQATDALHAQGYDAAILWTLRDNPAARQFYAAAGWTPDGGEDALDLEGPVALVRYARRLAAAS